MLKKLVVLITAALTLAGSANMAEAGGIATTAAIIIRAQSAAMATATAPTVRSMDTFMAIGPTTAIAVTGQGRRHCASSPPRLASDRNSPAIITALAVGMPRTTHQPTIRQLIASANCEPIRGRRKIGGA
jgi:hypothetical protein